MYEESPHSFVLPGERFEAYFGREGIHDVEEGEESGRLHGDPCYLAGDIESTIVGCLSSSIPRNKPL